MVENTALFYIFCAFILLKLTTTYSLNMQVLKKVDRHWVKCRREFREGLIPSSHVTQVENIPKLSKGQALFLTTSGYIAERAGDLSFERGMLQLRYYLVMYGILELIA